MPNRPATSAVVRIVKYAVLIVVSVLLITMASFRIQSYLFARKVHSVLEQMAKLQLQKTSQEEILTLLPELRPGTFTNPMLQNDSEVKCSGAACYKFEAQNWPKCVLVNFLQEFSSHSDSAFKVAYLLGHRFRGFEAYVETRGGRFSRYGYLLIIEDGRFPVDNLTGVNVLGSDREGFPSHFGLLRHYEEIGNFNVQGSLTRLGGVVYIAFTPEAQPGDVKNAFNVRLECVWNTQGCSTTKQLLPLFGEQKIKPGRQK